MIISSDVYFTHVPHRSLTTHRSQTDARIAASSHASLTSSRSADRSPSFLAGLSAFFRRLFGLKPKSAPIKPSTKVNWVIPGKLAVGGLPKPGDAAVLARSNIRIVLSLCSEREGILPSDVSETFRCGRLVLADSRYSSPMNPHQLAKAVEVVHQSILSKQPIYVHCLAGVERAPIVCIAYLCRYRELTLYDAVRWLKEVHPRTAPTDAQLRMLKTYLPSQQTQP